MTEKRQKVTKVKCKREESLTKLSIINYLWNIVSSRRSIWVLLKLVGRWAQHFAKIDQKTQIFFGQIYIWSPKNVCVGGYLTARHWFASSVWNFCPWVTDVPLHETSPVAKSKEKWMFSQATADTLFLLIEYFFSWTKHWQNCKLTWMIEWNQYLYHLLSSEYLAAPSWYLTGIHLLWCSTIWRSVLTCCSSM